MEVAQKLDLTQRSLGDNLAVKDLADLLDGDLLAGLVLNARAYLR